LLGSRGSLHDHPLVEERTVDQEADLVVATFEEMVLLIGVILITMVQKIAVVDMGLLVEDTVGMQEIAPVLG
jgi:hypothetical protein